jgi:AcrR family transcriptional regulator
VHLTRKRVIATAIELVERDGVAALSMQRLATELGSGLVALYNVIPSRAELLDAIADTIVSGIEIPSASAGAWQDQVRAQASAFRQVARAHPRCAMFLASRPPSSTGMMRTVERALATLGAAGFGGQDAARIARAITAYVIGSLLAEFEIAPGLADGDDDTDTHRRRPRPGEFPHLTAMAAEPGVVDRDADFEFGLDLLVHAAAAMLPDSRARQGPQHTLCTQPYGSGS